MHRYGKFTFTWLCACALLLKLTYGYSIWSSFHGDYQVDTMDWFINKVCMHII